MMGLIVATYDGTNRRLYLDGSLDAGPSSGSYATDSENWHIGTDGNGNYFDGTIDEIRISSTARSASWINTTFNNLNNPSHFYSIDDEEIYSNWWADKSFNSRRDIVIDQSQDENPLILRPNGVGTNNLISTEYPLSGTHWQLVSDTNDTTYVEQDTTNIRRDTYQTEDITGVVGSIDSVTVKVRVISSSTVDVAAEVEMITHGSLYTNSAAWHNNSEWLIYSRTWTNNPYTNQPWNVAEINDMEIGVELKGETGGNSRCSEVWAEVNYTLQEQSLSEFPILIKVTDRSFREGDVQSDAADFLFINEDGIKLPHEVEFFSQNTTHGELAVWVLVPELSLIDQNVLSMYYGNPSIENQEIPGNVWDSDFMGVWHLSESPTGTIYDSTSNDRDGTTYGSMTSGDQVPGQIDGALDFDGSDDYVQWSSVITLATGTYSMWIYPNNVTDERNYLANDAWQTRISLWDDVVKIETNTDGEYFDFDQSSIPINTWTHVVFVRNGDTGDLYINGYWFQQVVTTGANSLSISCIAGTDNLARMVDGLIDEVRISDIDRSAEWVAAEYLNQYNPDTFYTLGPRLSISSNIIVEETVSIGGADVTQLTTPSITAEDNDLYLLSVSMKPYLDVSTVTGLGLTWSELEDQPAGRSQTGVSVWYAQGISTTGGVTVTLASQAAGLAVSLSRISGVHYSYPIGATETANTNGIDGSGADGIDCANANVSFTTSNYGSMVFGIATTRVQPFTPAPEYTQVDVITGSTSGSQARITSFQKSQPIPGYVMVNGTNAEVDWAIAGIEIKPAIIDINSPIIDDFGVDDPGNGNGVFWVKIHDLESSIENVEIKINGTSYSMSDNGTHWKYQVTPNFNDYYEYRVFNATDSWGNNLEFPTSVEFHTFNIDNLAPTIQDWEYYDDIGTYGTFKANVSDSWGAIDNVIVNVTEGTVPVGDRWAPMVLIASGYMNDTIVLSPGTIKFVITVNDTAGNSFTSAEHQGLVAGTNQPPIAENVTLSSSGAAIILPILSNDTLYLDYDYSDPDSDPEGASEIRWYKNELMIKQLKSPPLHLLKEMNGMLQ
jgi:hypothetical protein